MNPVEKLLKQMSLRPPSEKLDHRVNQTVAHMPINQPVKHSPGWIVMLAVSVACLLIGIFIGQQWQPELGAKISAKSGRFSIDLIERASESKDVPPRADPSGASSDMRPTVELAQSSESDRGTRTTVFDDVFVLIYGSYPARKHRAITNRRVRIYDEQTGQTREVAIPIRRTVLVHSHGI